MQQYLDKLIKHEDLTIEEMKAATNQCFTDTITDTEVAAFLTALRSKGERADEITGIVGIIRSQSGLSFMWRRNVLGRCGRGGERSACLELRTGHCGVIGQDR